MNLLLTFLLGMVFLICFYAQASQYAVNWILVFGMLITSIGITLVVTEKI